MPTGKASAVVQGRVIAETDHWEVVEGNVYVCFPVLFLLDCVFKLARSEVANRLSLDSFHPREYGLYYFNSRESEENDSDED